ncbi:PEGA domain-containing protein [Lewinella sp. W8]|uniref:PEGA domain-containing protein n=1 Tax=Lewinella sp. W8 TaxID=2528208 RepID=UPI0010673DE0|nr:PEGA domain-containing protein [Lewinella sp. W8]MTB53441.1 PEGA domain-containing protein [Lewinella sp. W8]
MLRLILMCCYLAAGFSLFSQATGKVVFEITPGNAIVKVDGKTISIENQKEVSLPAGTYPIEVWAPRFEVFPAEVVVKPDETTYFRKGLTTQSPRYLEHVEAVRIHNNKMLARRIVDVGLVGGTVALAYLGTQGNRKEVDRLADLMSNRAAAYRLVAEIEEINQIREEYDLAVADYQDAVEVHNNRTVLYLSAAGVMAGATIVYFIKKGKKTMKRPVYEPQNPFAQVWRNADPLIAVDARSTQLGFTLKF